MKKTKNILSRPTFKRRLIQLYSALLFNSYLKGYITGDIFKGITKNVCTPGLNCYSCPGAVTSCPLGALQNAFASSDKRTPYYMLGIIMLYGLIFGRWICGWLCPFGFVQDLLHKIKTPKLKKGRVTKVLSYFKYVLLVIFVVVLPLIYMLRDLPLPAFCKYICPAGTLGGAIGLLINPNNESVFGMLGPLFTWKFVLMISFVVAAVFIYRIFCRFFCPLGALYGIFNKFALFGIKLEKNKCIDCGKCITVCKMDISKVGDHECINCGECIPVCPTQAIQWRGKNIILPESEIALASNKPISDAPDAPTELEIVISKREKRVKILKFVSGALMTALLLGAIVYFNFIHQNDEVIPDDEVVDTPTEPEIPEDPLADGKINVEELRGKVVVINFWGTWCGPCKSELPHFNEVAEEYADEVVFIAIHTVTDKANAPEYIAENYKNSKIIFAYDVLLNQNKPTAGDRYFKLLGGTSYYPRTLVLNKDGIITYTVDSAISKEKLISEIENAKAYTTPDNASKGSGKGDICHSSDLEIIIPE